MQRTEEAFLQESAYSKNLANPSALDTTKCKYALGEETRQRRDVQGQGFPAIVRYAPKRLKQYSSEAKMVMPVVSEVRRVEYDVVLKRDIFGRGIPF